MTLFPRYSTEKLVKTQGKKFINYYVVLQSFDSVSIVKFEQVNARWESSKDIPLWQNFYDQRTS